MVALTLVPTKRAQQDGMPITEAQALPLPPELHVTFVRFADVELVMLVELVTLVAALAKAARRVITRKVTVAAFISDLFIYNLL